MASFTISRADKFPSGTTVYAYPRANWTTSQLPPSGSPQGSSTTSATAGASSVAFTGLADSTAYFAYAQVGGVDTYVGFATDPPSVASSGYLGDYAALTVGSPVSARQLVTRLGVLYTRVADGTISGTFTPANWVAVASIEVAGDGAPANAVGDLGWFYFDATNRVRYGPKVGTLGTNGSYWGDPMPQAVESVSVDYGLRAVVSPNGPPGIWTPGTRATAAARRWFARCVPERSRVTTNLNFDVTAVTSGTSGDTLSIGVLDGLTGARYAGYLNSVAGLLDATGRKTVSFTFEWIAGHPYYVCFGTSGANATVGARTLTTVSRVSAFGAATPLLLCGYNDGSSGNVPSTIPALTTSIAVQPEVFFTEL